MFYWVLVGFGNGSTARWRFDNRTNMSGTRKGEKPPKKRQQKKEKNKRKTTNHLGSLVRTIQGRNSTKKTTKQTNTAATLEAVKNDERFPFIATRNVDSFETCGPSNNELVDGHPIRNDKIEYRMRIFDPAGPDEWKRVEVKKTPPPQKKNNEKNEKKIRKKWELGERTAFRLLRVSVRRPPTSATFPRRRRAPTTFDGEANGPERGEKKEKKQNKIICARRKMKSEGGANKIFQVRTNEIKIKKTSATCPAEKHDRLSQGKQKWWRANGNDFFKK